LDSVSQTSSIETKKRKDSLSIINQLILNDLKSLFNIITQDVIERRMTMHRAAEHLWISDRQFRQLLVRTVKKVRSVWSTGDVACGVTDS